MAEALPQSLNELTLDQTPEKGKISVENHIGGPITLEIYTDREQRIREISVTHPQLARRRRKRITREELFGTPATNKIYDGHLPVVVKISGSVQHGLDVHVKRPPSVYEILCNGCMIDSTDPFHLCYDHCYAREATYEACRADCHNPEQKTPDDTSKAKLQ